MRREETSNASGEIELFTRTSSVVMHPTKIGTVLIADGNGCKTVSAFIPRPVLKDGRAILVSNVPSGTWVGVQKLPRGRGKGKGVGRRRLPHAATISLGAFLPGKLKPRWPQVTLSVSSRRSNGKTGDCTVNFLL